MKSFSPPLGKQRREQSQKRGIYSPSTQPQQQQRTFLTLEELQQHDQSIKKILLSSKLLQPLHVEVNNISCWYYMRKKLKAKRHQIIQIKAPSANPTGQITPNTSYEGYIYDLKRREEDLEIVPKKVLVASQEDRVQVWKQCEQAMKERDLQRIMIEETPQNSDERKPISLITHIKITVVSEHFLRLRPLERMRVVYEELLHSLGRTVDPSLASDRKQQTSDDETNSPSPSEFFDPKYLYHCPPRGIKGISQFGNQVCQLPIFHFLSHHPLQSHSTVFIISALTPSQWKPNEYRPALSERLGETHLGAAALQVNLVARPKSQKDRVRKLTTIPNQIIDPFTGQPIASSSTNMTAAQQIQLEQQLALEKKAKEKADAEAGIVAGKKKGFTGKEMADSLGLDPVVSGIKYAKLGGIYGHFFQDLSPEIKELVMLKYENNRELIRDESRLLLPPTTTTTSSSLSSLEQLQSTSITSKKPAPASFQPKTNHHRFKPPTLKQAIEGMNDKGTKNPIEMREEVYLSNRKVELIAIRIQRIRRLNMYYRMMKTYWKQIYSAMTIQRCLRGHFGRRYYFLFQKLRPIAAMKIQRFYRAVVAHRIVTRWQKLVYRMTRRILPKIKKFIKNCFLSWIRRRETSAICIQTLVRKRLAKTHFYQQYGFQLFFSHFFPQAIISIQKTIRGFLGRKKFQKYLDQYLQIYIDIPAAIRIQRIFRGRLGKKYLLFLKYERKCLLLLQSFLRRTVHRIWDKEVRYHRKLKNAAITIQRYYRGHYDRKLYQLKYFFFYYFHVYVPSAIKVQSYIRRFNAMSRVNGMKRRWFAARTIQRSFRYYKNYLIQKEFRRRLLEAQRQRYVICIQKYIRRFLTYKRYQQMITIRRGQEILAAKIILRAWKTYKIYQKYLILLDDHRLQEEMKLFLRYDTLKKKIINDLSEIMMDIHYAEKVRDRLKGRFRQLDEFLVQAAFRLNKIQSEMNELVTEDFEKGWAEALGQEYEYITHQTLMAREELRLVRHKTYVTEEELFQLKMEYEENEIELDSIDSLLLSMMEQSRSRQILRAEKKANQYHWKNIYRERVHWKVTSNRTKKILNHRKRNQEIANEAKQGRSFEFFTTINFEKRQRRRDYESMVQEVALQNEARERDAKSKPKTYEEYAIPFQRTFDKVIHNSLNTLRGLSLDERAKRIRAQYVNKMSQKKKAQKGQFSSLKEDFAGKLGI